MQDTNCPSFHIQTPNLSVCCHYCRHKIIPRIYVEVLNSINVRGFNNIMSMKRVCGGIHGIVMSMSTLPSRHTLWHITKCAFKTMRDMTKCLLPYSALFCKPEPDFVRRLRARRPHHSVRCHCRPDPLHSRQQGRGGQLGVAQSHQTRKKPGLRFKPPRFRRHRSPPCGMQHRLRQR